MNKINIQNEIVKLENKFWDAMKTKDIKSAISLTHFPCTVAGPKGASKINEEDFKKMLDSSNSEQFKNIELKNIQVEVLNENTAIITYSATMKEGEMLDVSTWIKENGKWVCAFHSENPQKLQ